jgi:hypothetical protein
MISKPMVHLAQTVHLSCTDTNTILKRTKMRFHMTHGTFLYQACPKWFSSLWYIRPKLCTYLASRLPLSPNGLKRAFTWASSPGSTIGCVQKDFWVYGTFGTNRAPILHRHWYCLQANWNEIPIDPRRLGILSSVSKPISEPVVCLAQPVQLSCIKIITISKRTKTCFHLSLVT